MRRRVWSVEEIEGIMWAIHERNRATLAPLPDRLSAIQHYEAGFNAALATLAIALGLEPRVARPGDGTAISRGPQAWPCSGERRR